MQIGRADPDRQAMRGQPVREMRGERERPRPRAFPRRVVLQTQRRAIYWLRVSRQVGSTGKVLKLLNFGAIT
jgi:hypothetical protein